MFIIGDSERSHPLVLPLYMLSSNQVLNQGRYRIIDQFGSLDSGTLYEAYDTVSETKVVLRETVGQLGKVATATQIENFKAAFAENAKRLTEVEHPSLLKIKDFFSEIDRQYLVMESCEGSDLATLMSTQEKAPGVADILRWADQMLDGLHYLHIQNPRIIHQNINPQNARLTSNFKVKLFVASGTQANGATNSDNAASEDSDQAYKPLEQLWLGLDSASQKMIANSFGEKSEEILRQALDARTDVYSVGATVYFLLTKTEPADALARYLEILDGNDDPLQNPTELNSSVPTEVSEALMKALELKREDRFESAATMRAELAKVKIPSRLAETRGNIASIVETTAVPPESRLEAERLRDEKGGMELEAEQKRLEDERARIERRQLELAAEKKREAELLEARRIEERQKAEKLEAENAAAAEKLWAENAAADERARAEKLELARQQKRKTEIQKPSSATQSGVEKLQVDLAKDDLLDLPEHAVEIAIEPDPITHVLALDVERPVINKSRAIDTSFDIYPDEMSHRSLFSRPPVLVALAAIVLVAIGVVWMFSASNRSATPPAASVQTLPGTTEEKQPTQSVETPAVGSNPSYASQSEQPLAASPGSTAVESKAEQDARQKAHKQPTPQTKPTPEKKKVTVDDLINDN
jgi:serine/threonine protein kinase